MDRRRGSCPLGQTCPDRSRDPGGDRGRSGPGFRPDREEQAAGASEVFLQPANAQGQHPFTPNVGTDASVPSTASGALTPTSGTSLASYSGNSVGLYGGTLDQSSCNPQQMITYLQANPSKASAWAAAEGISVNQISTYIGGLTPMTLRYDTRVTNHGYVNGQANAIPEILQAGQAVLVDSHGVPRARCYCGNPLTPPEAVSGSPHYVGVQWSRVLADHRHRCSAIDHGDQQLHIDQQLNWSSLQPTSGKHGRFGHPSTYLHWWTEHAWRDRLHEPDHDDASADHDDDGSTDHDDDGTERRSGVAARRHRCCASMGRGRLRRFARHRTACAPSTTPSQIQVVWDPDGPGGPGFVAGEGGNWKDRRSLDWTDCAVRCHVREWRLGVHVVERQLLLRDGGVT